LGLPGIMHVEVDMLDSVADVRADKHQVLEGRSEAPKVSQINNKRNILDGDLGMCVHQC
jgi:hypothetical protein